MASRKSKYELILTATEKGFASAFKKADDAMHAFNVRAKTGVGLLGDLERAAASAIGAWLGFESIAAAGRIISEADTSAFNLSSSLQAANREFDNVGSVEEWSSAVARLSRELRIYSDTDLENAASRTLDMSKRLGLSAAQMEKLIEVTGNLSAGRTTLIDGIERTTAALRGEAEASEFLGLTLNETYVKGWYEARGALQGAWKDLSDLEKAQIRYAVLLEQAEPLNGRAAASTSTFSGALAEARKNITNAIRNNKDLADAMGAVAKEINDNADSIGDFVADITKIAAATASWIVQNKELVKWLAGGAGAAWALGKVVAVATVLKGVILGLDAAFLKMMGSRFIPWLTSIGTTSLAAVTGVTSLTTAFIGLAAASAAAVAAYKAGEWVTMREHWQGINQASKELEANTKKVNDRFGEISQSTGVVVSSMEELDQAVKEGRIRYDDLTGTWKVGAGEMADAIKKSADAQEETVVNVTDDMKAAYRKYVDEIKRLQDEIYGRELSLAEQLRSLSRTGMSDFGAWRDRKREAQEYEEAARRAAAAGDFGKAVDLADRAKRAYSDLNKEVKAGDKVVVSQQKGLQEAMDGVKRSGEQAIEYLRKQEQAAAKAAKALDDQTTGRLSEEFGKVSTKVDEVDKSVGGLEETIINVGGRWEQVWLDNRKTGIKVLDDMQARIDKMDGSTITVSVKEVQARATGGLIQKLRWGGHLPGYGGGDRIPALLEAGEFVIRKEAVRRFGARFFSMLNSLQIPRFQTGGPVGQTAAPAAAGTPVYITFPSGNTLGPFNAGRATVRAIEREKRHMAMGGS